jgi:hypothetical protein
MAAKANRLSNSSGLSCPRFLIFDADEVTDDRLSQPFDDFLYPRGLSRRRVMHTRSHRIGTDGATWNTAEGMNAGATLLDRIARGEGSSKATMVGHLIRRESSFGSPPTSLRPPSPWRPHCNHQRFEVNAASL